MKYSLTHYKALQVLKLTMLLLYIMVLTACSTTGTDKYSSNNCITSCGDKREIIISDVQLVKIEKRLNRDYDQHIQIDINLTSNFDIEESQHEYAAVGFTLRLPVKDKPDYSKEVSATVISGSKKYISPHQYQYKAVLFLRKENYQFAYDEAVRFGGLHLQPTFIRLFSGLPSRVRFEPVFLKLSPDEIAVSPTVWH